MAWRFPNRTGELGVLGDGAVALSGSSLPGMRSFAAALTANRIADGDAVGVSLSASADPSRWAVWSAEYADSGTLTRTLLEDESAQPLSLGETVQVIACVTDAMLRRFAVQSEVEDPSGPTFWTPRESPPELEWLPLENAWAILDAANTPNGWLEPVSSIAELRPTTFSIEVYVPTGTDMEDAAASGGVGFVLTFVGGFTEQYAGAGVVEGWNTVTGTVSGQTGDIESLGLFAVYDNRSDFRFRNFVAT